MAKKQQKDQCLTCRGVVGALIGLACALGITAAFIALWMFYTWLTGLWTNDPFRENVGFAFFLTLISSGGLLAGWNIARDRVR